MLDYLAIRFMDEGWSVKRLIREIVLSRTYQLSDRRDDAAYAVDPDNRLLWRFGRRRLEAEAIRDAILAASGKLDLQAARRLAVAHARQRRTRLERARSWRPTTRLGIARVYLPMLRSNVPEMLALFDMADPSLVDRPARGDDGRHAGAVPDEQQVRAWTKRKRLAERVLERRIGRSGGARRPGLSPDADPRCRPTPNASRCSNTFASAVGRRRRSAAAKPNAWTDVCQPLFGSAEFLYVR